MTVWATAHHSEGAGLVHAKPTQRRANRVPGAGVPRMCMRMTDKKNMQGAGGEQPAGPDLLWCTRS